MDQEQVLPLNRRDQRATSASAKPSAQGIHSSGDRKIQVVRGDITTPFGEDAWLIIIITG